MEVRIPKLSGFCPGVKNAERKLLELRDKYPFEKIYIYGELIHNSHFTEFLKKKHIFVIDSLKNIEINSWIVIRTHGIPKEIEDKLKEKYRVLDLTCIKVKNLQNVIFKNNGSFIIIAGKKNHPEVEGLISYAKFFKVLENEDDFNEWISNIDNIKKELIEKNIKRIFIVSQTTSSEDLFSFIKNNCKNYFNDDFTIDYFDSICSITSQKEEEALKLQKETEITFVIGDKKSSNANKLYNVLKSHNNNTYFIEDLSSLLSLNLNLNNYKSATVVSSASTPEFIEKEIVDYLKNI